MSYKIKSILIISLLFLIFIFLSFKFKSFILLIISLSILSLSLLLVTKINKNILLIYFTSLLSIILVEIFLKVDLSDFLKDEKISMNDKIVTNFNNFKYEKTYLGNQLKKGSYNHYKKESENFIFNVDYKIDDQNFRINPLIKNDKNKLLKISFFGGSDVFGWGLKENETLPYLFYEENKNYNVFNFGIIGGGAHQALHMMQRDKKYVGDINVIVTSSYHLPRIACNRDYSFNSPSYKIKGEKLIYDGYCIFPFLKLNFQIPKIFGSILNRSEIIILLRNIFSNEYSDENIKLYIEILKEIKRITIEENKKMIVLYYGPKKEIDKKIKDLFLKNNISNLDVSLLEKKYFIKHDKHFNKLANTIWYNKLSQYLLN